MAKLLMAKCSSPTNNKILYSQAALTQILDSPEKQSLYSNSHVHLCGRLSFCALSLFIYVRAYIYIYIYVHAYTCEHIEKCIYTGRQSDKDKKYMCLHDTCILMTGSLHYSNKYLNYKELLFLLLMRRISLHVL